MLVASQVAFQHMLQLLQHPLPPGLDRLEIQNYGLVRVVAHIHISSASYPSPLQSPNDTICLNMILYFSLLPSKVFVSCPTFLFLGTENTGLTLRCEATEYVLARTLGKSMGCGHDLDGCAVRACT